MGMRRSLRRARVILTATVLGAGAAPYAAGQTIIWGNNAGGTFNVGTNWIGGVAPGPANSAHFNFNNPYTVTFTSSATNVNASVAAGSVLFNGTTPVYTLTNELAVTGGTLTLALDVSAAKTEVNGGALLIAGGDGLTTGSIAVAVTGAAGTTSVSGSGAFLSATNAALLSFVGQGGGTGTLNFSSS